MKSFANKHGKYEDRFTRHTKDKNQIINALDMKKKLTELRNLFEKHKKKADDVEVVIITGLFDTVGRGKPSFYYWDDRDKNQLLSISEGVPINRERYKKLLRAWNLPNMAYVKIEAPNEKFTWEF